MYNNAGIYRWVSAKRWVDKNSCTIESRQLYIITIIIYIYIYIYIYIIKTIVLIATDRAGNISSHFCLLFLRAPYKFQFFVLTEEQFTPECDRSYYSQLHLLARDIYVGL